MKFARRVAQLVVIALLAGVAQAAPSAAEPVRLASKAFGERTVIEVRDLPRETGNALIREAFTLIAELEDLADRTHGATADLNSQAGAGPQPTPAALRDLLGRSNAICLWNSGAHGPLAGGLYDLWGRGKRLATAPDEASLTTALESSNCDRIRIDNEAGTVDLAAGTSVDLGHFAAGAAVDRAMEHLRAGGSENAWVRIGLVQRGVGPGPGGLGWLAQLDDFDLRAASLSQLHLVDRAIAIAAADDRPIRIGDALLAPYLDQRSRRGAPISSNPGHPADGILATAVVTDLAADAQSLAGSLFVIGSFEGQYRLGGLRPAPAVLWLLGGRGVDPIVTSSHWSQLQK